MIVVYKAMPNAGRNWGFGIGIRCETWREANAVRAQIAKEAMTAKDNSMPLCYDANGNLLAEGWQKGFA